MRLKLSQSFSRALARARLRGGETRDGHAERRARDIIEPGGMAEADGIGIAAVLAANAELQFGARLAPALDRDLDELADTLPCRG